MENCGDSAPYWVENSCFLFWTVWRPLIGQDYMFDYSFALKPTFRKREMLCCGFACGEHCDVDFVETEHILRSISVLDTILSVQSEPDCTWFDLQYPTSVGMCILSDTWEARSRKMTQGFRCTRVADHNPKKTKTRRGLLQAPTKKSLTQGEGFVLEAMANKDRTVWCRYSDHTRMRHGELAHLAPGLRTIKRIACQNKPPTFTTVYMDSPKSPCFTTTSPGRSLLWVILPTAFSRVLARLMSRRIDICINPSITRHMGRQGRAVERNPHELAVIF